MTMDEQVQDNIPTAFQQPVKLSAEQIEMLKAVARERAIAQAAAEPQTQRLVEPPPSMRPSIPQPQQPQIIYLRRNFTVAELLLVILLACGLVTGVQALWGFGSRLLPQIEIKVK
jgi:hypothetical protein